MLNKRLFADVVARAWTYDDYSTDEKGIALGVTVSDSGHTAKALINVEMHGMKPRIVIKKGEIEKTGLFDLVIEE